MLSDNAIENLIQPIIDRQESINRYVLAQIAEQIKELGELKPSDVYKLTRLLKSGADVRKINAELARLTKLQERQIKSLIREVAEDVYVDAKPFYDYRHLSYIPFEKNKDLQRVVKSVENVTLKSYKNMSNSTGFMIRDLQNPQRLVPTNISKTYQTVMDEAIQAVQSGATDYHTAMRRTIEQLADSGLRYVTYNPKSGRTFSRRLDSVVRQNLLDGVRAINQGMQDEIGKQIGSDGKELSAHQYSALDHEPFQGHQFTNKEWEKLQNNQDFEDVDGNKFKGVDRIIGIWNCRHIAFSIILGISKPNYTKQQLKQFIKVNHKGYTLPNGKHMTMYECTQRQRELETKVRQAKDSQIMAEQAGDTELAEKFKAKVTKYQDDYFAFSNACGLKPKLDRLFVGGYK